ncbi:serine hydrolase domain-containing protein [Devosia sp.]|uniref:serine hydrolase domain-containing protein n=1 Tax=Devosia sp. TaxID=1871048 RepID=UPI00326611A8
MKFGSMIALALLAAMASLMPASAQSVMPAVDEVVKTYVGHDSPGVAVLVMRHGKVLLMQGCGYADLRRKTPVDPHTVFDLASVSKQMTAQAAMLEIQEGALKRDTKIADVLPVFKQQETGGRPLKVDDLLHHVSGLADYLDGGLNYQSDTTNAEVIDWLVQQRLERTPGSGFGYSNSGYIVLASVVAAADHAATLKQVLENRIWEPLDMSETGLVTPAKGVVVATGYAGTSGDFEPSSYPTVTEGDGNVLTNLTDMAKYEHALATNELLSAKATAALFVNGKLDNGMPLKDPESGTGYGFGWELEHAAGADYAQHTGSWMGTSTAYQRNLDSGLTVIVLANGEDMAAADLAAEIEAAIDE